MSFVTQKLGNELGSRPAQHWRRHVRDRCAVHVDLDDGTARTTCEIGQSSRGLHQGARTNHEAHVRGRGKSESLTEHHRVEWLAEPDDIGSHKGAAGFAVWQGFDPRGIDGAAVILPPAACRTSNTEQGAV